MATPHLPGTPATTPKSDHLHVRPEGIGPAEFHFSFEMQQQRIGNAVGLSVGGHIAIALLLFLIARMLPEKVYESVLPDRLPDIVWIASPGPGGGGGGGGNKNPDPPKKVELKGEKPVTVPVKEDPKPEIKKEPDPIPEVKIPAETAQAAPVIAPGAIESTQAANDSQGKGELNGGGTGRGTGIGAGEGSGLGQGTGGGTGGGAFRPGNGVTVPQLVRDVKPAYTADAMRAKVQGTVLLECVVMPDGTVGRVEIVRSLDGTFGLDQEAIKAAKQWRFRPGMRFGEPVAVLVTIELQFTLR
jgi:periplasmic protein TonB